MEQYTVVANLPGAVLRAVPSPACKIFVQSKSADDKNREKDSRILLLLLSKSEPHSKAVVLEQRITSASIAIMLLGHGITFISSTILVETWVGNQDS